ncbi:MAG: cache domain-containing protein [Candidatus Competibacteraceae bacterium]|nr:cache domain-containing protein [Candidatus Competibacteraceae bacterium]
MRITMMGSASLALMLSAAPAWVGAMGPDNATAEEVVAKVHEAAKYLHDKGQAGFPDFNNNARWVWKDSYVFVYSCRDNKMIAHPLRPDLVGKPILQMADDKGNLLFQKLCEASNKADGGWVEYWWPKPGEAKASRKISYTQRTEVSFQPDVRVGAGIYDEATSVEELNKLAQEAIEPKRDAP